MRKNRLPLLIGVTLAAVTFGAMAQTMTPIKPAYEIPTGAPKNEDGPRGMYLTDGVAVYPSIGLSVGRDDNLFLSSSNKTSSTVYSLAPGLKLQARRQDSVFTLDYSGLASQYQQSRADDFYDFRLGGTGEFVMSSRAGLRLLVEHIEGHDGRGSTDRSTAGTPDKYRNFGGNVLFAYGGNEARGRFEFEAGDYLKTYLNNRASTFLSDRNTYSFAGRFFGRFATRTWFLVEARSTNLNYVSPISLADSREKRYLAGVTWDATAATSGTIKVGRIRKDFDSSRVADFSGTGWDASVQWTPLAYSRVGFFAVKDFNESTGVGDFILSKRYGVNWAHDWNSRLTTIANLNRRKDDFINGSRNDTTDNIGFKLNYKLHRWLILGGEYTNADRTSNNSIYRYKRNIYMFTLGATL